MVIELWLVNWYKNHLIQVSDVQREYSKTNDKNSLRFIEK